MNITDVELNKLEFWPGNARTHGERNLEAIKKSLEKFGQVEPLVVQARTNRVIGGNGRLRVLLDAGYTTAKAYVVDLNDTDASALNIALNRTAELAEWDSELLAKQLGELAANGFQMDATGFDSNELARLLAASTQMVGDPDDVPAPAAEPYVKSGEVYVLGEHKLICGDATSAGDVERLMGSEQATCMWTDPPYGVDYVGGTKKKLTIANDGAEGLGGLLSSAFELAGTVLSNGAAIYVAHPAGANSVVFCNAFVGIGWRLHETLVWVKDAMVLGHSDYHYIHEPILFGYAPGGGRRGRGGEGWYGGNNAVSVFNVPRPRCSDEHPTSKPVALVSAMLANSTKPTDIVYEPFSGSGSTLIACEQLGRRCRAIEISPTYAQVAIERWERLTGRKARKE